MFRYLLILTVFVNSNFLFNCVAQNISLSNNAVTFKTTLKNQSDTQTLVLKNLSAAAKLTISNLKTFERDMLLVGDTIFSINPLEEKEIKLVFRPRHNVNYNSELWITTEEYGVLSIDLKGIGQYPGTYYSSTFNLFEEALKTQLRSVISNPYFQLGYTPARNWLFESIDNQKFNGQGASVNTAECVYTGKTATGWTNRTDVQNQGFNTEHTYPQSMFASAEPMQSDLFHLFIVDENVNTIRSNNRFRIVSNPTWTGGGSLSDGTFFEPRNQHKGNAARATLYFALKYGNMGSFLTLNESILRDWVFQFPVNRIDSLRNENIYNIQKNRNPLIDHPEFLERISSLSVTSTAAAKKELSISRKISFGQFLEGVKLSGVDTINYFLSLTASGNEDILISTRTNQGAVFSVNTSQGSIKKGDSRTLLLQLIGQPGSKNRDTLYINSSAGNYIFPIESSFFGLGQKPITQSQIKIYPNPAQTQVLIFNEFDKMIQLQVHNTLGQLVFEGSLESEKMMLDVTNYLRGVYYVNIKSNNFAETHKLIIK
jgi:hypothetical protein